MKILVTGATGFIGRALVLRLMREGHALVAYVRSEERARAVLGPGVALVPASQRDDELAELVGSVDAVVNLAGEGILAKRWSAKRRQALVESRIGITRRLVDAIAAAPRKPSVLIAASAVGYYGNRGDEHITEDSAPGTGFAAKLCVDWELEARRAEALGVRVVLLRIGLVLGRDGGMLATTEPIFRAGLGGRLGSGRQYLPWIHQDDMVEIIACAIADQRYRGAINATAPNPVRNRDFTEVLAAAVGRRPLAPVPGFFLRLALGEAGRLVLGGQYAIPAKLIELGYRFRYDEVDEALRDIYDGTSVIIEPAPPGDVPAGEYLRTRAPRYVLTQRTVLNAPLDDVFAFFSDAGNLSLLTPSSLSFSIITPMPIAMKEGAIIDYRIKIAGVPVKWRTRIERWEPGVCFVDAQYRGPYRAWWHEHHFEDRGDGTTLMIDRVYYAPPFGPIGRLSNWALVAGMLRTIFTYRAYAIRLRFGIGGSRDSLAA